MKRRTWPSDDEARITVANALIFGLALAVVIGALGFRYLTPPPSTTTHNHGNVAFDSGILVHNATWPHHFMAYGDYPYHCHLHPDMMGIIRVMEPSNNTVTGAVTVRIANFTYAPATLDITPMTTIRWINDDQAPHTVMGTAATAPREVRIIGMTWWQAAGAGLALLGIILFFALRAQHGGAGGRDRPPPPPGESP